MALPGLFDLNVPMLLKKVLFRFFSVNNIITVACRKSYFVVVKDLVNLKPLELSN